MDDVFVRIVKLPGGVRAFTMPGAEGMNVYISQDLDRSQQLQAYAHELGHILDGDFEKESVQEIEYHAHKKKSALPAGTGRAAL